MLAKSKYEHHHGSPYPLTHPDCIFFICLRYYWVDDNWVLDINLFTYLGENEDDFYRK